MFQGNGPKEPLSALLRRCCDYDMQKCTGIRCARSNPLTRYLLNQPPVIAIGLTWSSAACPVEEIVDVINALDSSLDMGYVFEGADATYRLRGMVCLIAFDPVVIICRFVSMVVIMIQLFLTATYNTGL